MERRLKRRRFINEDVQHQLLLDEAARKVTIFRLFEFGL